MKPELLEIFGFHIYGYGLMIAIGIICATYIFTKNAGKRGYNEDKIFNLIILTVIMGVIGGKLLFIITEIKDIIKNPSILLDFGNGFVIYGAIILGALTVLVYCKLKKWNPLEVLDCIVPAVAIAQGFGRIGCLLAGCCYGAETSSPLSIVFPSGVNSLAPIGIHLHPTQIYSSIFDFALGIFLLWYLKKKRENGKTFGMYVIIYSIGRFIIEFLRNDPRGNVGILSTSQFIAIFTLIIGILVFNIHRFRKGNTRSEEK